MTLAEVRCGPREARGNGATAPDGGTAGPGVAADESGNHAPARSMVRSELCGDASARNGGRGAGGREGGARRAAPGRDAVPGRAVSERGGRGRGAAWAGLSPPGDREPWETSLTESGSRPCQGSVTRAAPLSP